MKRNLVTRKNLEAMGYKAYCINRGDGVFSINEAVASRATETFEAIVNAARNGQTIIFNRNKLAKEVQAWVPSLVSEHRGVTTTFLIIRPMTPEELA